MPIHPIFDRASKLFYGFWTKGWRDIVGYEEIYEVNHISNVRNKKTRKILKPDADFRVRLTDKNGHRRMKKIYHLALQAFFPHIPQLGRGVDHIDEDHTYHYINNLQWMKSGPNASKSLRLRPRKNGMARSKPIEQWSKDGTVFIREFASACEATRETKIAQGHISNCANGESKSAGGYLWKYKLQPDLPNEIWATHDRLQAFLKNPKERISNMGRIMTAKGIKTKGSKVHGTKGHRKYANHYVHQLVWAVWGDERPVPKEGDSLVICHNDSIPRDEDDCVSNAIEHLRLDTHSENTREWHREKAKKRKIREQKFDM